MGNKQEWADVSALRQALLNGHPDRVAKQRRDGKMTARERVIKLLDQNSFAESGVLVSDGGEGAGVITGFGTVRERSVYVISQDYTVRGGAIGRAHAAKVTKTLELARMTGTPVVMLFDSAGIRLDEGMAAIDAYTQIGRHLARLSGVCPLIAVVAGPCIGAAAILTRLFDITLITDPAGALMAQGPQVLGAAADTDVTLKSGGTATMAAQGMVSLTAEDEAEALGLTARPLDLLPGCNLEDAPILDSDDMNRMLPEWDGEDVRALAGLVADRGTEIELHQAFDATMLTFLCRMGGRPAGLIVCNAKGGEGLTTASGARKAARFVRMCDCFNLPVITLIDTQGMEVTAVDSQGDILNAAAQLFYAYAEATCPKAAVIIGDAVGQGYLAMCGQTAADTTYAWPGAVISALTPEAAVQTLYANEINEGGNDASLTRKALAEAYAKETASAFFAARNGYIDDVIDPAATRQYLIAAIEMLASKRESSTPKKHGNLPL